MLFKWNEETKEFVKKGKRRAFSISAGLNGHALMKDQSDRKLYGWVEAEQTWKSLGGPSVRSFAIGKAGKLYKVDYRSRKVFQ